MSSNPLGLVYPEVHPGALLATAKVPLSSKCQGLLMPGFLFHEFLLLRTWRLTGLMDMYGVYHMLPPTPQRCRQLLSGIDSLRT